ncbi:uncharacterized protein LOC131024690 [Salvia miltiorrhiza]|uniref:uncharacterized protein LOC131024690 n=1 Tax=Salvia miltiorrhiza TaxID=226208 RepID=UPI0025ACE510|nr:uncharacterized protein LOC131024690 [Salvia miltiorrhiza]
MNQLRFQGQLLLHLLLHIDMAASNNTTLVFNINNSSMEFQPTDFHLITGLRLVNSEASSSTTTSSSIHKRVFQGRPTIMFKDVEEAFLDVSHDHEGRGEVTLKLALLYFLYGVVLPASPTKKIDLHYLHLADNLEAFNAFPWGQVAHELLVSSMLSARLCMDSSRATRLVMHGFIFALQVWAYEKLPSVATHCAAPAHNLQHSTVQILRWSATKIIRFQHLKPFFTLGDEVLQSAQASPEQQNAKVEPSTWTDSSASTIPQGEDVEESLQRECDQPIPDTRNESPEVEEEEEEEAVKEATATATMNNTFGPNKLAETERTRALFALAYDNPVQDTQQPLWKTCSEFEISEAEYERSKVLYEMLMEQTKRLKLWISYAQFEAFAMIEGSESELADKRKRLERARDVFERGLSYFRSCTPQLKEERAMLLNEWFDMEYRFGEVGEVGLVRARLPQKLNKIRRLPTGYEEYIDYLFPEEEDVEMLKKHKIAN